MSKTTSFNKSEKVIQIHSSDLLIEDAILKAIQQVEKTGAKKAILTLEVAKNTSFEVLKGDTYFKAFERFVKEVEKDKKGNIEEIRKVV